MELFSYQYDSPIGNLQIDFGNKSIRAVIFANQICIRKTYPMQNNAVIEECVKQFDAYFQGNLSEFNLPLYLDGTPWRKSVWSELQKIPFGQTTTYKQISKNLGKEFAAARAVGSASNKNPIPIIIPCHRVIGSDGKLVGFAGGIWRKQWLLEHEQRFMNNF